MWRGGGDRLNEKKTCLAVRKAIRPGAIKPRMEFFLSLLLRISLMFLFLKRINPHMLFDISITV